MGRHTKDGTELSKASWHRTDKVGARKAHSGSGSDRVVVDYGVDPALVSGLRTAGVRVLTEASPENRLRDRAAVVVLDSRSPTFDVSEIRTLRTTDRDVGIVVVIAPGPHEDPAALLDAGADDVWAAHLCAAEAAARLRALLRRMPITAPATIGPNQFGAHRLPLTPTESNVLAILAANPGRVVSRRRLLHEVWGYPPGVRTNVLGMCIRSLRRKLADAGTSDLIDTVRGIGFRLQLAPI
ncbi:winged-helix domain-containing protein [Rhodococcus sp. NPDC056960]|uniref:winged helix-turn-helix transcriptional regulator n=1 Tax=Rhodococcus sp. NPDC056960 TaxID=3345982 RepID=UPI00362B108B